MAAVAPSNRGHGGQSAQVSSASNTKAASCFSSVSPKRRGGTLPTAGWLIAIKCRRKEVAMKKTWCGTFAAVAVVGLLASSAMAQGQKQGDSPPQLKQMKLTDKQVQGFISAQKDLAPLRSKLEGAGDKLDPALQAQLDLIAKKNGFSSGDEFDDVAANIAIVLSGLDQSGQFTEPPEQIKKDIEEIKQDAQLPQKEKEQVLAEMQEALKTATPLKFKENVVLVKKYQKELDAAVPNEPAKQ